MGDPAAEPQGAPGPDGWYTGTGDPAKAPKYLKALAAMEQPGKSPEFVKRLQDGIISYRAQHHLSEDAADQPSGGLTQLPPDQEGQFQTWYRAKAKVLGIDPNPDDPNHFYDYRAAYKQMRPGGKFAGEIPSKEGDHWPSEFKLEGHPRTNLRDPSGKAFNTKTMKYEDGSAVPEGTTGEEISSDKPETPEQWRKRREAAKQTAAEPAAPPSEYDPVKDPARAKPGMDVPMFPEYYYEPATGPDDAKYQQALDQAQKEGTYLKRYKDLPRGPEAFGAFALPYLGAAAHALSRARTLGVADRAMGAVSGPRGEEARKNIRDVATQGVDLPGLRPTDVPGVGPVVPAAFASAMLGGFGKGSAMNPIASAVQKVSPKGIAGIPIAGAATAGAASLGESAVDAAANALTGQPQEETVGSALDRAGGSMAIGAPMAFGMHALQAGGAKGAQKLREGKRGADIVRAEQGGVETNALTKLKPTPEIQAAQQYQASSGVPAQEVSKARAVKPLIESMNTRREAGKAQTSAENQAYYNSPAGQETASTLPVVKKMLEIRDANTLDESGQPIPFSDFAGSVKKSMPQLAEAHVYRGQQTDNPIVTRKEARAMGLTVKGVGPASAPIELVPTQITPDKLEQSITNLSNAIDEGRTTKSRHTGNQEQLLSSLRSVRDQYQATGPEGPAPESLSATTRSGKKQLSGYSAMKAQQGARVENMNQVIESLGLNSKLKELNPNDRAQWDAVENRLTSHVLTPEEMQAVLKDSPPHVEKLLRTAIAHQAMDKLKVGSEVSMRAHRAFIPDALRFDPAMRAVGNYREPAAARESATAARTGAATTILRQNLQSLREALSPKKQEQGATP